MCIDKKTHILTYLKKLSKLKCNDIELSNDLECIANQILSYIDFKSKLFTFRLAFTLYFLFFQNTFRNKS